MSIEYVFQRFCEILSDQVEKGDLLREWNKNSFCFHILTSGPRKGEMCEKKCDRNTFYCKAHASDVVLQLEEDTVNETKEKQSEERTDESADESVEEQADESVEERTDERVEERTDESVEEHTDESVEEHVDEIKSDL